MDTYSKYIEGYGTVKVTISRSIEVNYGQYANISIYKLEIFLNKQRITDQIINFLKEKVKNYEDILNPQPGMIPSFRRIVNYRTISKEIDRAIAVGQSS
jgi:hypothetical protein